MSIAFKFSRIQNAFISFLWQRLLVCLAARWPLNLYSVVGIIVVIVLTSVATTPGQQVLTHLHIMSYEYYIQQQTD